MNPDARERLVRLRDTFPGGVVFKIDNGCCGGTTLLLIDSQYLGSNDICVGAVEGVGVYVEASLLPYFANDHYHIYIREGARDSGFSIEVPLGFKFLMHRNASPAHAG